MTNVMFIENSTQAIEDARQLIEEGIADPVFNISGFEVAQANIGSFEPDIVVLDLEGVPDSPTFEGFNVRDFIWDHRFCPIVIYSAFVEDYEAAYDPHPLIKTVAKGSGSPERVLDAVQELLPVVTAVRTTREQVDQRFWESMKAIAPVALRTVDPPSNLIEVIIRSGRRRVAAMMDIPVRNEAPLASWEQYLYPPVSPDLELGDVLRIAPGRVDDPTSFRVTLTPSCDMVSSGNRTPKVQAILVAKCCSISEALSMTNMTGNGNERHRSRLQTAFLSQGFYQSMLIMPELAGAIPPMAANLRDLQLIAFDEIGSEATYNRIASVDSPFKETVAWAYLQISCRPGLPERDLSAWTDEIIKACEPQQQDGQG